MAGHGARARPAVPRLLPNKAFFWKSVSDHRKAPRAGIPQELKQFKPHTRYFRRRTAAIGRFDDAPRVEPITRAIAVIWLGSELSIWQDTKHRVDTADEKEKETSD